MKKQLIALRGPSNVGKSTSLHLLYRLLVSDPVAKPLSFTAHGWKLDFVAIIEIAGYKVGLTNRGDVPKTLKEVLRALVRKRCDIVVCAARTRGTVGTVLAAFDPPHKLVQVLKRPSKTASHSVSNLSAAHELASLVYAAIDA